MASPVSSSTISVSSQSPFASSLFQSLLILFQFLPVPSQSLFQSPLNLLHLLPFASNSVPWLSDLITRFIDRRHFTSARYPRTTLAGGRWGQPGHSCILMHSIIKFRTTRRLFVWLYNRRMCMVDVYGRCVWWPHRRVCMICLYVLLSMICVCIITNCLITTSVWPPCGSTCSQMGKLSERYLTASASFWSALQSLSQCSLFAILGECWQFREANSRQTLGKLSRQTLLAQTFPSLPDSNGSEAVPKRFLTRRILTRIPTRDS